MSTITIDIHGLYVEDALELLRERIRQAPQNTERIIVVHGYNNGTALQTAVRTRLRSPRIRKIEANFFNDGQTDIWLQTIAAR